LIYFTETARLQHMTEASLVLNVAQSALSRQISLLENDLGIKLFKREGRNIRLTDEGRSFYEDAVKILEIVDESKDKISDNKNHNARMFNIHITKSDMTAKLLQSFQQFLDQNDLVNFNIESADESTLEDKLLDHTLDLVISTKKFEHENIESTLLFDQHYYYIFRESSKVNLPVKASLNELEDLSIATLEPILDIEKHFKRATIQNYNDASIIQHLLIHHGYVAILSYEETRILKHNYPNFIVHKLNHLNIKQPLYAGMLKKNKKPFVHKWFDLLKSETARQLNRMMN